MSDKRPSEVLGALPRTRPHRRSDKRAARPVAAASPTETTAATPTPASSPTPKPKPKASTARTKSTTARAKPSATRAKPKAAAGKPRSAQQRPRLRQPAQPAGTPRAPKPPQARPSGRTDVLGTAVQAAAELAEIGISVSARALRSAVSRLPRP